MNLYMEGCSYLYHEQLTNHVFNLLQDVFQNLCSVIVTLALVKTTDCQPKGFFLKKALLSSFVSLAFVLVTIIVCWCALDEMVISHDELEVSFVGRAPQSTTRFIALKWLQHLSSYVSRYHFQILEALLHLISLSNTISMPLESCCWERSEGS